MHAHTHTYTHTHTHARTRAHAHAHAHTHARTHTYTPDSYWTDNGACYYYTTGEYANYEDALVAVKEDADKSGLPYRYMQVSITEKGYSDLKS